MKVTFKHKDCDIEVSNVRIIRYHGDLMLKIVVDTVNKWPQIEIMSDSDGAELVVFLRDEDSWHDRPTIVVIKSKTLRERRLLAQTCLQQNNKYGCEIYLVPEPTEFQFQKAEFVWGPGKAPRRKKPSKGGSHGRRSTRTVPVRPVGEVCQPGAKAHADPLRD